MNCSQSLKVVELKLLKKWLDELTSSLTERSVAEIGISYSGSADWAKEMKESLQAYVEQPISVLEQVLLFRLIQARMHGLFWYVTIPKKIKKKRINSVF